MIDNSFSATQSGGRAQKSPHPLRKCVWSLEYNEPQHKSFLIHVRNLTVKEAKWQACPWPRNFGTFRSWHGAYEYDYYWNAWIGCVWCWLLPYFGGSVQEALFSNLQKMVTMFDTDLASQVNGVWNNKWFEKSRTHPPSYVTYLGLDSKGWADLLNLRICQI